MAINKSYNENLKYFRHEILYGTTLKNYLLFAIKK